MVNQTGTFETVGRHEALAEDEYADALLRYWAAVKEAEETIAPFFVEDSDLTTEQRDVIADVVAQVARAEDAYFDALEVAGQPRPKAVRRSEDA